MSLFKCAKPDCTDIRQDPDLPRKFYRFPKVKDIVEAFIWAVYCFPKEKWSVNKLKALRNSHLRLCSNHFHPSWLLKDLEKAGYALPYDCGPVLQSLGIDWDRIKFYSYKSMEDNIKPFLTQHTEEQAEREVDSLDERAVCECCSSTERKGLLPLSLIQETPDGLKNYCELIQACFSIEIRIDSNEGKICKKCASKLDNAELFRREVLRSQELLHPVGKEIEIHVPDIFDSDLNDASVGEINEPALTHEDTEKLRKDKQMALSEIDDFGDSLESSGPESAKELVVIDGIHRLEQEHSYKKKLKKKSKASIRELQRKIQNVKKKRRLAPTEEEARVASNISALILHSNLLPFTFNFSSALSFRCVYCRFLLFRNFEQLRRHVVAKHANTEHIFQGFARVEISDISCRLCPEIFTSVDELKIHLNEIHNVIPFPSCCYDPTPFIITDDSFYQCGVCALSENNLNVLTQHIYSHYPCVKCVKCDEVFPSQRLLYQHESKHADKCLCQYCGSMFLFQTNLLGHIKMKHTVQHRCSECDQVFPRLCLLKKHLSIEHDLDFVGDIKCRFCDYSTNTQTTMRAHVKTKHKTRHVYTCVVCDKTLSTNRTLKEHMMMHQGAHPYKCDICDWGYMKESKLIKHKRAHQRCDFECPICRAPMISEKAIVNHLRKEHPDFEIHWMEEENDSGNKVVRRSRKCAGKKNHNNYSKKGGENHKCDICNKNFLKEANLKKHKILHQKGDYECPICRWPMTTEKAVVKHVRKKHPDVHIDWVEEVSDYDDKRENKAVNCVVEDESENVANDADGNFAVDDDLDYAGDDENDAEDGNDENDAEDGNDENDAEDGNDEKGEDENDAMDEVIGNDSEDVYGTVEGVRSLYGNSMPDIDWME